MDKAVHPIENHDAINRVANNLIKRMAGHEAQAMGLFFDSTLAFVYGHAISVTDDPERAEAVVADTYLYVWKKACHYNTTWGTPLEWLLQITDTRARHLMRGSLDATAFTKSLSEKPCEPEVAVSTATPKPERQIASSADNAIRFRGL